MGRIPRSIGRMLGPGGGRIILSAGLEHAVYRQGGRHKAEARGSWHLGFERRVRAQGSKAVRGLTAGACQARARAIRSEEAAACAEEEDGASAAPAAPFHARGAQTVDESEQATAGSWQGQSKGRARAEQGQSATAGSKGRATAELVHGWTGGSMQPVRGLRAP